MKIPVHLKLLSYLFEVPLEKRKSEISGTLEVSIHRGEYKLSSQNAIYSFGKHYTSFKIAFETLSIQELPFKKVLILGAGLGSIAQLLGNHPHISSVTAVDIDPVIIDLAKKYWPKTKQVQYLFVTADAFDFVEQSKENFDLILSDIFIDDQTPEHVATGKFLHHLKHLLTKDGCLIYSKLDLSKLQNNENRSFGKTFQSVFKKGFTLQAEYNRMFVARGE